MAADHYSIASGASLYAGWPRPPVVDWVPAQDAVATLIEANSYASVRPADSPPGGYSYVATGSMTYPMVTGWSKIIDDYSGGAYNPYWSPSGGPLGSMLFFGGGHAASDWNGVAAFDFNTRLYSVVLGGSLDCHPVDLTNCENHDGSPMASHTYDGITILGPEAGYPKGALITVARCAAGAVPSAPSNAAHCLDFAHLGAGFTRLAAHVSGFGSVPPGTAAAYDADLARVWWADNTHQPGYMAYFDLATSAHKKVSLSYAASNVGAYADSRSMRYARGRNLIVQATATNDSSRTREIRYLRTDAPALGWAKASLSTSLPSGTPFDWDWVPRLGKFVAIAGTDATGYWTLRVPDTLTDAWTVERVPYVSGSMTPAYIPGRRFSYVEALDCIVFKRAAADAVQVLKL